MLQGIFGRKQDEDKIKSEGRLPPGQSLTNREAQLKLVGSVCLFLTAKNPRLRSSLSLVRLQLCDGI